MTFYAYEKPTISVIIPSLTEDCAQRQRSLESIAKQSATPHEVLIVSPLAGNLAACAGLGTNGTWQQIHDEHWNLPALINAGVRAATGDIVAFLKPGDFWEPHYLSELLKLAQLWPDAHYYSCGYQWHSGGATYKDAQVLWQGLPRQAGVVKGYVSLVARGDLPIRLSGFSGSRHGLMRAGLCDVTDDIGFEQKLFFAAQREGAMAHHSGIHVFIEESSMHYGNANANAKANANAPEYEHRFSLHVSRVAAQLEINDPKRYELLSYCGQHLTAVAHRNIRSGHLLLAKSLLRDPRSRHPVLKHCFLTVMLRLKMIFRMHARAGI